MLEFVALERWHLDFMGEMRPVICEDTRGITALRNGKPEAVCVMDNWSHTCCQMHIWIGNPFVLRHGYKDIVFDFVRSGGRKKVLGITPADNSKALRFNRKIGFTEIFRVKDGYKEGVDYVVQEISLNGEVSTSAA